MSKKTRCFFLNISYHYTMEALNSPMYKGIFQRSWSSNKKRLQCYNSSKAFLQIGFIHWSQTAFIILLQLFNKVKDKEWPHWEFYRKLSFMLYLEFFFLWDNTGMEMNTGWHLVSGIKGRMQSLKWVNERISNYKLLKG